MNLTKLIQKIVREALNEDRAHQDLTSRLLVDPNQRAQAVIRAKQAGVLCGVNAAAEAFKRMDPGCRVHIVTKDGSRIKPGQTIMAVRGRLDRILSAERTALNFLQHLSGVATLTRKFVDAAKGSRAKILDTRKTVPGLRLLQKYAVLCGGGHNHRMDLSDAVMVKDNHWDALRHSPQSLRALKKGLPKGRLLIIEAKTAPEVERAIEANADVILLDNMGPARMKRAIRLIRSRSKAEIEVSGGVTLKTVKTIARLGVDRISVGAITHSAPALDLSLDLE